MNRLRAVLKVVVEQSLNDRALLMLAVLHMRGQQSMVELARACDCTQAAVTGMVDRLDAAHLVAREVRVGEDRRNVHVGLTAEGRTVVEALAERMEEELALAGATLTGGPNNAF